MSHNFRALTACSTADLAAHLCPDLLGPLLHLLGHILIISGLIRLCTWPLWIPPQPKTRGAVVALTRCRGPLRRNCGELPTISTGVCGLPLHVLYSSLGEPIDCEEPQKLCLKAVLVQPGLGLAGKSRHDNLQRVMSRAAAIPWKAGNTLFLYRCFNVFVMSKVWGQPFCKHWEEYLASCGGPLLFWKEASLCQLSAWWNTAFG